MERPTEQEIELARRAVLISNVQEAIKELQDEMEDSGENPGQWQGALLGFYDLSGESQATSAERWGEQAAGVAPEGPAALIARRRLTRARVSLDTRRSEIESLASQIVGMRRAGPGRGWDLIDELVQLLMTLSPRPEFPPGVEELEAALAVCEFAASKPLDKLADEVLLPFTLELVRP